MRILPNEQRRLSAQPDLRFMLPRLTQQASSVFREDSNRRGSTRGHDFDATTFQYEGSVRT